MHPELHNLQVSVPDYLDWKKSVNNLELAAYTFQAMDKATLSGQGVPVAVQGTNASQELFAVLGIKPLLGHIYSAEEEKQPVILISEQLWRRKFSADPQVIDRTLQLGKSSFTIVGVLNQKNAFPVWADVWMPLSRIEPGLYSARKFHPLEVIGRLKPNVPLPVAEIELETIARQLSASYPATNAKIGAFVVPLMETVIGEVRTGLVTAWVAVALVLLIACANLAHLMMGRALNRQHEIAVRLALGASRLSVLRAFFLESSVLSLAGGLLGILTAHLALPLIQHLANGQVPRLDDVALNFPVLSFGLLASVLVAILFALPSYLQVLRSDLNEIISSGNTRGSSIRRSWLSPMLMSSEVALSLAVLLAAVVLVRSFSLTLQSKPGFESNGVLAVHSPLVEGDWQKSYDLFRNRVAPELVSIPGVREVATVNFHSDEPWNHRAQSLCDTFRNCRRKLRARPLSNCPDAMVYTQLFPCSRDTSHPRALARGYRSQSATLFGKRSAGAAILSTIQSSWAQAVARRSHTSSRISRDRRCGGRYSRVWAHFCPGTNHLFRRRFAGNGRDLKNCDTKREA